MTDYGNCNKCGEELKDLDEGGIVCLSCLN